MDKRPIGIFDSGVGGLTVVKELFRQLPCEKIVYFGDTARVPYGNKSRETVSRYATEIADFLISKHKVKILIVACNTASALSLEILKKTFPHIPVFGVIKPAALKALQLSKNKKIAVIGTEATVTSGTYPKTLRQLATKNSIKKIGVYQSACPLLVPLVEEGRLKGTITEMVIKQYLKKILPHKPDILILGCTHYPLLEPVIKKILGPNVAIVDSASAVVEEVKSFLTDKNILSGLSSSQIRHSLYCVSDSPEKFSLLARRFLKTRFNNNVKHIDLTDFTTKADKK